MFKLFATLLLIALGMIFYSCSKEENNTEEITINIAEDIYFKKYGINIQDYKYYNFNYSENNLVFNGMKDGVFTAMAFDTISCQKICEFIDTESTPETVTKYIGYGESKELNLENILSQGIVLTNNGYIGSFTLHYGDNWEYLIKRIIYFSNGKKIETIVDVYTSIKLIKKWFNDSAIVSDSICYNDKGETIFIAKEPIQYNEIPVTYTDGVNIDFISKRINHATGEIIWESELEPPFEIPSNAKNEFIILEKENDFWKCKINTLFYDGTKKNFTFEINISNGIIKILS